MTDQFVMLDRFPTMSDEELLEVNGASLNGALYGAALGSFGGPMGVALGFGAGAVIGWFSF